MRELKPVLLRASLLEELARSILKYFEEILFRPLESIFFPEREEIKNAVEDELLKALKTGAIEVKGRYVVGKFNARLSHALLRAGAEFVKSKNAYKLSSLPRSVSTWLANELVVSSNRAREALALMATMEPPPIKNQEISFGKVIDDIDHQLRKNIAPAAEDSETKAIGLPASLDEQAKENLDRKYLNNLDLDIKKWAWSKIKEMRNDINDMVLNQSISRKGLKEYFEKKHNVTAKKAVFLARQESSLLLSSYTANKYREAGIKKFKWSTSKDVRVRKSHEKLQGKIFKFDRPPAIRGRKLLPGEDYNCRCVPRPIVD
jgi:SPP1 gp7 family putative phage head morphogenesis protein